MQSHGGERKTL